MNTLQMFYGGDRKLGGKGGGVTIASLKDTLTLHVKSPLPYFQTVKTLNRAMNSPGSYRHWLPPCGVIMVGPASLRFTCNSNRPASELRCVLHVS